MVYQKGITHMPDEKKKDRVKIAVLGGDRRQLSAAERLTELGYTVSLYGFDTYGESGSPSLEEAVTGASCLLFPVPVIRNERWNLPFSEEKLAASEVMARIAPYLDGVTHAFGGVIPEEATSFLRGQGITVCDLTEEERFNVLNAVPTAEGAIAIAMNHLDVTLNGSSVAVLGFGRIGKALCRPLTALGAKVTAVSRKERDRALSEIYGCRAVGYEALPALAGEFDVIFNTVPAVVLTEEVLRGIKKDALVIDLASRPGGVDADAALRCGATVVVALSLPGKVAPVTAGHIIAHCLHDAVKGGALS
jgi:dipicolinate synthase subunit A